MGCDVAQGWQFSRPLNAVAAAAWLARRAPAPVPVPGAAGPVPVPATPPAPGTRPAPGPRAGGPPEAEAPTPVPEGDCLDAAARP
jgi:hypothetical protein